ncbi:MAG TPA: SulP family inorganic anion transporter [Gemmataceae bacterium]|nr:SulP family inorganic anion transporter [Gemmataceae bacterium]
MDLPKVSGSRAAGSDRSWRHDFLASIVVFLVALPLCMGIAIASGAPLEKAAAVGLITGIVGGLVVGLLGGSCVQVSGPAAGLSVIVFELSRAYGWEMVGVIVLLGGVIQFVAGLLRLGQWFRAVSPAVIHGMLAGIGVLIVASQFHIMVDDQPRGSGLANLLSIPEAVWKGIVPSDGDLNHEYAARIGLLTIVLIVLWRPLAPKALRVIPAPLVAVTVATAVTALLGLSINRVQVPDNLADAISLPNAALLERLPPWPTLLFAAASLAFIASAETLLCATAVDQLHQGPRTRYDRELAAQGIGNMICGTLGALPMTGVIVRSATNVEAGARTRLSAILHGAWLLLFVCLLPGVLRFIPTAALAAVLVYTGYRLVNVKAIRSLWGYGKSEAAIYAATLTTIVVKDLLTGVLLGIALSMIKLLYTFSHLNVRLETDLSARRATLYLEGAATFIRLPRLAAVLEAVPPNTELHVHFEKLTYIDHACLDLLLNWEKQHEATGGSLVVDWESLTARFRRPGTGNGRGNNGLDRSPGAAARPEEELVAPKAAKSA